MDLAVDIADTTSRYFFLENKGHLEPIKIEIIKNCPKLLRIYGINLRKVLILSILNKTCKPRELLA